MANKTLLYGSQSLAPDDKILYVEISPGIFALATASVIISGAPGGTTEVAAPIVNIEPALSDEITGATVTIPVVHHEVHEGTMFTVSLFSMSNPNNTVLAIRLATGAMYGHLLFAAAGGGNIQVRLLESPSITAGGTPVAVYNMKRYSANTNQISAFVNPVYTGGTVLTNFLAPGGTGGNSQGGVVRRNTEWILSPNSDYVFDTANIAGNNQPLSLIVEWYEEAVA